MSDNNKNVENSVSPEIANISISVSEDGNIRSHIRGEGKTLVLSLVSLMVEDIKLFYIFSDSVSIFTENYVNPEINSDSETN